MNNKELTGVPSKDGYVARKVLLEKLSETLNDPTCPLHIAAEIEQDIAFIPAADVAPVIHARWVQGEELKRLTGKDVDMDFLPIQESNYYCTNCHDTAIFGSVGGSGWDDFVDGYPEMDYFKTRHCPYCGAKMDAKEPPKGDGE